jgi:cell division protein FtsL
MEDVIFILAVIMFIIAVFALYWQISSWKIQRALLKEKRDSTPDNDKSDDKRLRQSALLSVSISLTVIALGLQIHSWFMQYDEYEKKRDGEKRSEQMDSDYLAFQNKESLSTDIKPDFKVDVKNFDMVINASIGEKAEDDLSAMIWRYEPGKYVLSQTPEGRAILGTI